MCRFGMCQKFSLICTAVPEARADVDTGTSVNGVAIGFVTHQAHVREPMNKSVALFG